jgi:hypothetical protein
VPDSFGNDRHLNVPHQPHQIAGFARRAGDEGAYRRPDSVALEQVEAGTALSDARRKLGVSAAAFYLGPKKYSRLDA